MAITYDQYLQSLLRSVTTYYTATYSTDTELYNVLRMYGIEFTSGSTAVETVRNNLFITTCENTALYDNFGTYFGQGKYTDQTYVEDRYISGSGTFSLITPTLKVTQTATSLGSWAQNVSSNPSGLPVADTWTYSLNIGHTVVFDDLFISNCYVTIGTYYKNPGEFLWGTDWGQYYNLVAYNPATFSRFVVGNAPSQHFSPSNVPVRGLTTHRPYYGRGVYDSKNYLYFFAYDYPGVVEAPPGTGPFPTPIVYPIDTLEGGYPRLQLHRLTSGTRVSGSSESAYEYDIWNTEAVSDILFFLEDSDETWGLSTMRNDVTSTESVIFHNNMYWCIAGPQLDTSNTALYTNGTPMYAPDETNRYPLLFKCTPYETDDVTDIGMTITEAGLATYVGGAIGTLDYDAQAMEVHDNKLWIDVSRDTPFQEWEAKYTGAAGITDEISDFTTSGSSDTYFAATGINGLLLTSDDEGDTWSTLVDLTDVDASIERVHSLIESGSFLYAGTDQGEILRGTYPFASGDWTIYDPTILPDNIYDFAEFGGHLYAACDSSGSIFRTTRGTDWVHVNYGPATVQDMGGVSLQVFDGYLYAAGDSEENIIRSSDGVTWEFAPSGLGTAGDNVGYLVAAHGDYLYARNNSGYLVFSDDGTTWRYSHYFGYNGEISAIFSYLGALYVGLENGELWVSPNDGTYFFLMQNSGVGPIRSLSTAFGYAFCGTFDESSGKIYKWGGSPIHHMVTYDGTNFASAGTPAVAGDTVVKMISHGDYLYAAINHATNGYTMWKYDGTAWATDHTFTGAINAMSKHNDILVVALHNGDVFYLNPATDSWTQYAEFPNVPFNSTGATTFVGWPTAGVSDLYSYFERSWYVTNFVTYSAVHYAVTGAGISGSAEQRASIPGYRKQLDFMLDAAVHGGTHHGITRAANAFTLVNPDIRNAYATPQWKLKSTTGPISSISSGVWRFTDSPSWRDNLWQGAHATFTSGSLVSDKIAVGYIVLVNDNNTVNVGPIYDLRLLMDLTRIGYELVLSEDGYTPPTVG